jgi:tetratricopeptide (TPR) repeat protein
MGASTARAPSAPTTHAHRMARLRAALRSRAPNEALTALDRWISAAPTDGDLWAAKAIVLRKGGRPEEAAASWHEAVRNHARHDDLAKLMANLARALLRDGDEVWALGLALSIRPNQQALLTRLFSLQIARGDGAALMTAERLVALNPGHVPHQLRRATCLIETGRTAAAEAILTELIARPDPCDAAVDAWARFMIDYARRPREAVGRLRVLAARSSSSTWTVHRWLGNALARTDCPIEAIAALERAAGLAPNQADVWYDLAVVQRQSGLVAASQASFAQSLEIEPNNPSAMRIAGYDHKYEYGDPPFRRVSLMLASIHQFQNPAQVEVHYAVAKALEDVGDLDAAFAHYARAGQLQKSLSPWTAAEQRRLLAALKTEFTPELHRRLRHTGYPSKRVVFVVGMPRSGTSLVEQIIASHPSARGAGETKLADAIVDGLRIGQKTIRTTGSETPNSDYDGKSLYERGRRYVEAIDEIGGRGALRLVDKRPGNFVWTGLLDAALPGSYFIHCRRHPVDACLSAYRLHFGGEIPYSYDLRDLGLAYRSYHAFMAYWSDLLPKDRILPVRLDDLTADFEGVTRRILEFIELPWDDACLRFFENPRIVRTGSATQVRRPIYRAAADRHRYEPYLRPLIDTLGPVVSDYEAELVETDLVTS